MSLLMTRGHGQSDVIAHHTKLAEDVIDILDALNIEKAHFCGISMGGITGLWLVFTMQIVLIALQCELSSQNWSNRGLVKSC
jgi:esterase/lipase